VAAPSSAAAADGVPPAVPSGVPLLVSLAGQRVVCVGAGPVATAKAAPLLAAGADLIVVSPTASAELAAAAAAGRCRWLTRAYATGDLAGALLVVAGTDSAEVNARVAADAAALPALCVRVDAAAGRGLGGSGGDAAVAGTAAFLATVRRGPLLLAVSTSGQAPTLSRWIRADLEATYDDAWGDCAALLGELRRDPGVRAALAALPPAERRARWRSVPVRAIVNLLRNGSFSDAKDVAAACLSSSSD